jgi:Predicted nucleotide-binding protein containing TIR-like domain
LADVAELADALDSKSSDRKIVWVRSPPSAELVKTQLLPSTHRLLSRRNHNDSHDGDCKVFASRLRAQQNVILEFGYFLGKFGPAAVCALYEPGVELPSDVSGMLYIPLEDGVGWMLKVATELKGAGIDVDLNRIF